MNKLTIIIPCYNCEQTLEEAVDSIYTQNIDIPFEIVMVDDKSTDNTVKLMKKIANKYKEIKLFYHEENKGGGATRNTAVKNSTGDIIFCLDSDDILPPNTLPKMYKYLKEKECDGVTIHKSIKFKGRDTNDVDHIDVSPFVDKEIPLNSLISKDINYQPLFVNFMYTRNAFDKLGGYPTTHGYDTPGFGWRFMCAGLKAYTCPESSYLHRINFKESYYVREYNEGKINFFWRDILLENYYIFNKEILNFIISFNCKDFSKNLMSELKKQENILAEDYENKLGQKHPPLIVNGLKYRSISRNSIRGYYIRIKKNMLSKKIFNLIKKIVLKIYRQIKSYFIYPFTIKIDRDNFKKIYSDTKKKYLENIKNYNYSDFLVHKWKNNLIEFENFFINNFSFSFLNNKIIKGTMFMYTDKKWRNIQKQTILKEFDVNTAKNILRENNLGKPLLNDWEFKTSGNSIHHLYHISKFQKETGLNLKEIKTIVEIGGGYGNMARIFKKINNNITYIIIDIPVFSYLQEVYLKTILGEKEATIVNNEKINIVTGHVNLIPLDTNILKNLESLITNVDLLISTWALSESNKNMQEYVELVDNFKSKYILYAYQKKEETFRFAEDISNINNNYQKIYQEETDYAKDNYYLFCKRKNV